MNNDKMELIARGRQAANEIAQQGINGWGNTINDLCDALSTHGQESEPDILDSLDWERIRSGQRRSLNPGNQPIFDKYFGGQESEAQENDSWVSFHASWESTHLSPLTIETAAKMQAAEVCKTEIASWEQLEDYKGAMQRKIEKAILATIPQDGITALEEFGMKVAKEILETANDYYISDIAMRAIVKELMKG